MSLVRVLFAIDDFKTLCWSRYFDQARCCAVNPGPGFFPRLLQLLPGLVGRRRVDVFVFRYLNDSRCALKSLLLVVREALTIFICRLSGVRVIWLLHNIDRETVCYYPRLTRLRRTLVHVASERILVTDPNLVEVAARHGIRAGKLDWICFGAPFREPPDTVNQTLKQHIAAFRSALHNAGAKQVLLGLCVSAPAVKKTHFLDAVTVVGRTGRSPGATVALVMIGTFPQDPEFDRARQEILASPYIMLIEEAIAVNEYYIADEIDFFYRSMNDQSVAYTSYVASALEKPLFTQARGALAMMVERERLGFVIPRDESDVPGFIAGSMQRWQPRGGRDFLATRNWETGADRLSRFVAESPG